MYKRFGFIWDAHEYVCFSLKFECFVFLVRFFSGSGPVSTASLSVHQFGSDNIGRDFITLYNRADYVDLPFYRMALFLHGNLILQPMPLNL